MNNVLKFPSLNDNSDLKEFFKEIQIKALEEEIQELKNIIKEKEIILKKLKK